MDRLNYHLIYFAETVKNCSPETTKLDAAGGCQVTLPAITADQGAVTTAVQLLFGIVGALAVFFIIIGGFKYITSQDEPQSVAKARSTIVYAVIGLVIALSAEFIVTFVLKGI